MSGRGSSRGPGSTSAASEQVAEPGSFLAADAGGIPVLATRDTAGELRAFINVCRHRGAVLTEGCGDARDHPVPLPRVDVRPRRLAARRTALGARARLRSRRLVASARERRQLGAVPLRQPRPRARRRSRSTSATLPEILARDIDLDGLTFHSRVDFGSNANWKIVVENFLECYHCPTAHPGFSAEVDVHPDRYLLEAHPTFSAQFATAKQTGERGQFHLLYPNTGINVFPGPANLSIGPISPNGTGRTERYLDYFFAPDVDPAWRDEFFALRRPGRPRGHRRSSSRCTGAWRRACSSTAACFVNAEPLLAAFQSWVTESIR